eukprot:gene1878-biopygen3924
MIQPFFLYSMSTQIRFKKNKNKKNKNKKNKNKKNKNKKNKNKKNKKHTFRRQFFQDLPEKYNFHGRLSKV